MISEKTEGADEPEGVAEPARPNMGPPDIQALQVDLIEAKESLLRLALDFESYKRAAEAEFVRRASAEKDAFIRALLPLIDRLQLALAHPAGHDLECRHAAEAALRDLLALLHEHGIEAASDVGRAYDPLRHEISGIDRDPTRPADTVLKVLAPGYHKGGEVFRPAQVILNVLDHTRVGDGS